MEIELPEGEDSKKAREHRAFPRLSWYADDLVKALIIGIAGLLTGWCGYQSDQWSQVGSSSAIKSLALEYKAGQLRDEADSREMMDISMYVQYRNALALGRKSLAQFYFERFSPELRRAVEARTLNPRLRAPASTRPFSIEGYELPQRAEADKSIHAAMEIFKIGAMARETASRYVLSTLGFTIALLLLSIGSKLEPRSLRRAVDGGAAMIFVAMTAVVLALPKSS